MRLAGLIGVCLAAVLFATGSLASTVACWQPHTVKHADSTLCVFRQSSVRGEQQGPLLLGRRVTDFDFQKGVIVRKCKYQPPAGGVAISEKFFHLQVKKLRALTESITYEDTIENFVASLNECGPNPTGKLGEMVKSAHVHLMAEHLDRVCYHQEDIVHSGKTYTTVEIRYRDDDGFCEERIGARYYFNKDGTLATSLWQNASNNGWGYDRTRKNDGTFKLSKSRGVKKKDAGECMNEAETNDHHFAVIDQKKNCKTSDMQDARDTGEKGNRNTGYENIVHAW